MKESRIRPILLALLVAALLIIPLIAAADPNLEREHPDRGFVTGEAAKS
jgi:hypothetical protein